LDQVLVDIQILQMSITRTIQAENFGLEDQPHLLRIAKQNALSIAIEDRGVQKSHLKALFGWKDGAFVKSSYFGPPA